MNAKLINSAADVICRAMENGRSLPATLAAALDDAGMLQSPETAAEQARIREERDRYRIAWRMAYQRAQGRGWAADRAGARVREGLEALQNMLFAMIAHQLARKAATDEAAALRARVHELEQLLAEQRPVDEDPITYQLTAEASCGRALATGEACPEHSPSAAGGKDIRSADESTLPVPSAKALRSSERLQNLFGGLNGGGRHA